MTLSRSYLKIMYEKSRIEVVVGVITSAIVFGFWQKSFLAGVFIFILSATILTLISIYLDN